MGKVALWLAIGCFTLTAGCSKQSSSEDLSALRTKFVLAEEPVGVLPVEAAIENLTAEEDEIVVLGRIGGLQNPCDDSKAMFVMVDPSVDAAVGSAAHACGDDCKFCKQEKAKSPPLAIIAFMDANGQTLAMPVRQLLDIAPEQMVVVRGRAKVDPLGNLAVSASGVYIRR